MPAFPDTGNGERSETVTFTLVRSDNNSEFGASALPGSADCPEKFGPVSERRRAAASIAAKARWATRGTIADVLAAGVDRSAGPEACWPWTGGKDADGYGHLSYDYKTHQAHKVALEVKLGRSLARGEVSRHKCIGSRACCNPDHLQPGTVADNNRDTLEQGRVPCGEANPGHRLTALQVADIRREASPGRYEKLGRRYGVSGKTISNIARGLKWKAALAAEVSR